MTYIETKKAEFLETFKCIDSSCDQNGTCVDGYGEPYQCQYCDQVRFPATKLIDTLLDEIESRVVTDIPECTDDCFSCSGHPPCENRMGADDYRSETKQRFQNLRTRVEEVKEIPGFEGTMDALGKLDITS